MSNLKTQLSSTDLKESALITEDTLCLSPPSSTSSESGGTDDKKDVDHIKRDNEIMQVDDKAQELISIHEDIKLLERQYEKELMDYTDKWNDLIKKIDAYKEEALEQFHKENSYISSIYHNLKDLKIQKDLLEKEILSELDISQPFSFTVSRYQIVKKTDFVYRVSFSKRKLVQILGEDEGEKLYEQLKEPKVKVNKLDIEEITDEDYKESKAKRRRYQ